MKFERGDITATPVNTIEKLKKRYNLDKESGGKTEIPDPLTIDNLIVNLGASFTGNVTVDGDVSNTGDISSNGSVSSMGDIYEGGTKLEDKYLPFPTEYVSNLTWTDWANTKTLTWTVHGSGFVYVTASTRASANNDTGTAYVEILLNGNLVAVDLNRLTSASTVRISASTSAMMNVSDGDTITINLSNTKGGTAEGWRRATAFGCTLTES